jgi:catechol 2,3-dioxygenase-like lactoylglutathione lyase family enzyme
MRRRTAIAGSLAAAVAPAAPRAQTAMPPPLLERIRIATIAAPDVTRIESLYTAWLGQTVRERGVVPAALAASWGAPAAAGRPYVLMSSDAHPDVFIRAVETDPAPGYKAMTTWGWNAIEIVIDDIDALYARLKDSPFTFIGLPKSLGARYPTIHAMQVKGPAEEVLYLTTEKGDRTTSPLPRAGALVGRPFIMVIAAPDIEELRSWWADTFLMERQAINTTMSDLTRTAQNAPADAVFTISLLYLKQHGNILQLDGYPPATTARPAAPGQLPPGVSVTSFEVADLDAIKAAFITPPVRQDGLAYGGARVATTVAPGGALVELIERTS